MHLDMQQVKKRLVEAMMQEISGTAETIRKRLTETLLAIVEEMEKPKIVCDGAAACLICEGRGKVPVLACVDDPPPRKVTCPHCGSARGIPGPDGERCPTCGGFEAVVEMTPADDTIQCARCQAKRWPYPPKDRARWIQMAGTSKWLCHRCRKNYEPGSPAMKHHPEPAATKRKISPWYKTRYAISDGPGVHLVLVLRSWAFGLEVFSRGIPGRSYWLARIFLGPWCLVWSWARKRQLP